MATRRPRRDPEPGTFVDPLSNYDAPSYEDGLERSLCEDQVTAIQMTPVTKVSPGLPVREAIRLMHQTGGIGCLVICEQDRPIGVFSERDALRVAVDYDKLADLPLSRVMTPDPIVARETDPPARIVNLMANARIRHIPVVDIDGKMIGIIGPRRLTHYLKQYFADVVGG